jgi:hypothetical protein
MSGTMTPEGTNWTNSTGAFHIAVDPTKGPFRLMVHKTVNIAPPNVMSNESVWSAFGAISPNVGTTNNTSETLHSPIIMRNASTIYGYVLLVDNMNNPLPPMPNINVMAFSSSNPTGEPPVEWDFTNASGGFTLNVPNGIWWCGASSAHAEYASSEREFQRRQRDSAR